jgi:hypothetical protein
LTRYYFMIAAPAEKSTPTAPSTSLIQAELPRIADSYAAAGEKGAA